MTPERHAQIKELFIEALAVAPQERQAFLDRHCGGDDELRQEVGRLLALSSDLRAVRPPDESETDAGAGMAPETVRSITPPPWSSSEIERLEAGTIVASRYRVVSWLGRGGMGTVYRAEDLTLQQAIALKFLDTSLSRDPIGLKRFHSEARLAREVTHRNVCRVFDVGDADGTHFITMEYVAGENLAALLKRIGRIPQEKAYAVTWELCAGLAAIHRAGVLHRDLKPANVMLDSQGSVRITDFGLAGLVEQMRAHDPLAGTPAYMAPEQFTGGGVTTRSDIYCLGLVIYEILVGQPVFSAPTISEYIDLHVSAEPEPIAQRIDTIDPGVADVVMRCLHKRPDTRPGSAFEVAASLPGADALAEALDADETPSPTLVAAATPRRNIPSPAALCASTAALLLMLFALRSFIPSPWERQGTKDPAVLREVARTVTDDAGYGADDWDEAWGYCSTHRVAVALGDALGVAKNGQRLELATDAGIVFWYRRSAKPLVPVRAATMLFGNARAGPVDPPHAVSNSVFAALDQDGRLLALAAAPVGSAGSRDNTLSLEERCTRLVRHAKSGIDPFRTIGSKSASMETGTLRFACRPQTQPADSDLREAWLELSQGRLRSFIVSSVAGDKHTAASERMLRREFLAFTSLRFEFLVVTLVALPWAWRNYRRGSADVLGASRVAVFVFVVRLGVWSLQARHIADAHTETANACIAVLQSIGLAALVGLLYLAAEPFVRSVWPHLLITWSRAVASRFHDPLLGRHVLMGLCLGCFWALVMPCERLLAQGFGLDVHPQIVPERASDSLLGGRLAVAGCLNTLLVAMLQGFLLLLLLVLARVLIRKPLWAAVLAGLLIGPVVVPRGAHPATSLALIGAGLVAVCLWSMIRFGLVTVIVAIWIASILNTFPVTFNLSEWYANQTLIALLVVGSVSVYGFLIARPARPGTVRAATA